MELVRRSTSSALSAGASAGLGADVNDLSFTQRALHIDDLPAGFPTQKTIALRTGTPADPPAQEPTLAHIARQEPKPLRLADGSVVQRRIGWALRAGSLTKTIIHRPLVKDGSKYRPNGDWAMTKRAQWAGTSSTSTGKVSTERGTHRAESSGQMADPYEHEKTFKDGYDAMSYLPAGVRRSLHARVATPLEYDGKVVQHQDGTIEVVVVRADATTAATVLATMPRDGAVWDVNMTTFGNATLRTDTP